MNIETEQDITELVDLPVNAPVVSKNHGLIGIPALVSAAEARRMAARWAAQRALARIAAQAGGKHSALAGWQMIVEAQAKLAQDPKAARSVEAARFVAQATGFDSPERAMSADNATNSQLSAAFHVVLDLVSMLRDERQRREIIDVTPDNTE